MPRATVSVEPERFSLKTAPPDGWVLLQRMSYGQKLERQTMATTAEWDSGESRGDTRMMMALINKKVVEFEYRTCIIDHNLEDENGIKLDFTNPFNVNRLDPRIGEEIQTLLSKLNNFEEVEQGNSGTGLEPASS